MERLQNKPVPSIESYNLTYIFYTVHDCKVAYLKRKYFNGNV